MRETVLLLLQGDPPNSQLTPKMYAWSYPEDTIVTLDEIGPAAWIKDSKLEEAECSVCLC